MANLGPSWTDNVAVQAPFALLKGGLVRTTFDLRTAFGAFLKIGVGRYATGNLNAGLDVAVRRVMNNDGAAHAYGASLAQFSSDTTYGNQLINNPASLYPAGWASGIAFDGQAGGAFGHGETLCFWGQTAIPSVSGPLSFAGGVNMEMLHCSSVASSAVTPDTPLKYVHNDNEYFTLGNSWELWLPGGSAYALIFDAGNVTTTSGVYAVMADLQRFDKLTKVS